jgi:hypothetical protein
MDEPRGVDMKKILVPLGLILILAAACVPSGQQINEFLSAAEQTALAQITFVPVTYTPNVATIVAKTMAAMTVRPVSTPTLAAGVVTNTPPSTFTITPTLEPGSISGRLSYPSDFIPPLRVVAFEVGGYNYRFVDTTQNQNIYHINGLRPGVYHIVAYVMDGNYAGGYTHAVPCGLAVGCTDHSLIEVTVEAGKDTPDINPGDWYAPEGSFPSMP